MIVVRVSSLCAAALVLFAGVTCTDLSPTGPRSAGGRGGLTRLGFVPAFSQAATEIFQNLEAFGFEVDNVHLHLNHASGATAADTIVVVSPGQDSVVIELSVTLDASQEQLNASIELRDGETVLFSGTQTIAAKANGISTTPPPIAVNFTGPGATVTTFSLAPKDTGVITGDSIAFRPSGKDKDGQNVPILALAWSVKNEARGSVNEKGVFKASAGRGSTYVIARLLSGPKDSALVNVTPPATKVVVISGGGQTATVGKALPQAIVIEAQASDNLPVPFVPLTFHVASGGGSVSPTSAFADANGRATVALKLGNVAGANTLEVTAAGVAPAVISATGTPDKATELAMSQQPSATASSGTAFATQPRVRVRDAFGNAVAAANIGVTAKLTAANGRTLGGTLTVNTNDAGVAEFTDLKIFGPPGTASLTFGQDTLSSAVSSNINVAIGPAAIMTIEGSSDITHVAGSAPSSGPSLLVTDAGGNGVADVSIKIVATQGGSTTRDTIMATDATGHITFGRLPVATIAGSYVLTLSNTTLSGSPKVWNLAITPAAAAKLQLVTPPSASVLSGTSFAQQPVVKVTDTFGNTVTTSTANVTATITSANTLTGTTSKAAVAGIATFTDLGVSGPTGTATVTFSSTGLANVSSAISVTAGAPSQLTIVSGDGTSVLKAGGVVPKVRVRDASNNNLQGIAVRFAIVSGGGNVNGNPTCDVVTNTSGEATCNWQVGTTGAQVISATVAALTPVQFTAYIPEKLLLVQAPSPTNPPSGAGFATALAKVQLADINNHPVALSNFTIRAFVEYTADATIRVAVDTLNGMSLTNTDGIATFDRLFIEGHKNFAFTLKFKRWLGTIVDPDVAPVSTASLTLQTGAASKVASDNAYRRFPTIVTSPTTFTFNVSDGFNAVAGQDVVLSVAMGAPACSLSGGAPNVTRTSDANGVVSVEVLLPGMLRSCLVLAQFTMPPSTPVLGFARAYMAPDGMATWTGAVSDDWSNTSNWFGSLGPGATTNVFVPVASGSQFISVRSPKLPSGSPTQSTLALVTETAAHIDLNGKELYVRDSLVADGSIEGPGIVSLGIIPTLVRGVVHALLELGEDGCPTANQYTVSGVLVADSILANCPLHVGNTGTALVVNGDFRAPAAGGGLYQSVETVSIGRHAIFGGGALSQGGGTLAVGGNLTLNGATNLTAGTLTLAGNFSHQAGFCDGNRIFAQKEHTLWFNGITDTDTLRVTWNPDGECTSQLGTVKVATTGNKGLTIVATRPVYLESLQIVAGGKLRVPQDVSVTAAYGNFAGTGVFVQEGGTLTNDGSVTVILGSGDNCPVGSGVIPGPFICANHPM